MEIAQSQGAKRLLQLDPLLIRHCELVPIISFSAFYKHLIRAGNEQLSDIGLRFSGTLPEWWSEAQPSLFQKSSLSPS